MVQAAGQPAASGAGLAAIGLGSSRRISASIQASTSAISSSCWRPMLGIWGPIEISTWPGFLNSALRGQHLAEVTATGITGRRS